uniref:Peptidase_M14 domain-containing protein n=1 Tax=Rhodnius prolixus TaxID=13249 RepID=T1HCQ8_RHOPR
MALREETVDVTNAENLLRRSRCYSKDCCSIYGNMRQLVRKSCLFSIVNLLKGDSLYNEGMRPVMYSLKEAVINKIGWKRCGSNINYYQNYQNGEDEQNSTYTLTFTIEFPHDDDCVYLAHSYPYTYTDLQEYLIKLQNHPVKSEYTKLRLLCKTLAGNNVYYLTVTDPMPDEEQQQQTSKAKKRSIVVTARVHPGEAPSSWMMKGVIDYLTGDSPQAKELREKFIFKLIPMLNPDGVIVGNNRCSLSGRDLNRQYRTVIRETYPPVWHAKVMIKKLIDECGVAMYCDFHAHSRKHNVFIYGCENRRATDKRLQEQVFPLMLHKNTADKFSFENCKFRVHKDKEGTGRVVIWMMGVDNSYTLEASFAGSTIGSKSYTHFNTVDYENMGKSFCETLLDYVDDTPCKLKLRSKIILKLQKEGSSADEPANIELSDYSSDEGELSELSDDEKRKREEYILTAPPPSPVLLHERKIAQKEGTPKLHKHPPPIVVCTPPVQRKTMQIPTAVLDLDNNEGISSGDEVVQKSVLKKPSEVPKSAEMSSVRGERILMPPELIVTSSQGQEINDRLNKSNNTTKAAQKGHLDVTKSLSRRGSCKRHSPARMKQLRQSGDMSDPEGKAPTEISIPFKQQFWRVLSSDNLPWTYANALSHEQLLKACSLKLAELKKKHKSKKEKLELTGLPMRQPSIKRNVKQRRTKRTEESGCRIFKFLQSFDKIPLRASPETLSGDESVENSGNKKKKKKRKILQLQKHMKSAVTAVTAVALAKKESNKTSSKKKS